MPCVAHLMLVMLRLLMPFVAHVMRVMNLNMPEQCSFPDLLFHLLFMPKYAEKYASRMDISLPPIQRDVRRFARLEACFLLVAARIFLFPFVQPRRNHPSRHVKKNIREDY